MSCISAGTREKYEMQNVVKIVYARRCLVVDFNFISNLNKNENGNSNI